MSLINALLLAFAPADSNAQALSNAQVATLGDPILIKKLAKADEIYKRDLTLERLL